MTQGSWRKLFIAATVLMVISIILCGNFWQQLNNTRAQLDETRIQLDDTIARLNAIELKMESLEDEQDLMNSYTNLREQINLRLGIGQDSQRFITPDEPEISAKVQEIAGDYSEETLWKGYASLFRWMIRDIKYSADSPIPLLPESINGTLDWGRDFWRLPTETIRDGAGDCEDMALLLTSMLLNYNQRNFPAWIIGVRSFDSIPKAHIAIIIPIADKQLAILDVAGRYHTPFTDLGGFGCQDIPLAIAHWLNHLELYFEKGLANAQIYMVFSEDFYQEFSNTQEFVDWIYQLSI